MVSDVTGAQTFNPCRDQVRTFILFEFYNLLYDLMSRKLTRYRNRGWGGVSRVYTYCLQEVPGQVIGTVVTCNGLHCDNVTGGGGREDVGCGVGCNMGNIDNKVGPILISTKRFIVHPIRCFYRS